MDRHGLRVEVTYRWIQHGTPDYEAMVDLRDEVLRRPLGMAIDRSKLDEEAEFGLLTAWNEHQCVGSMVLTEEDPNTARMRAVAVHGDYQGQGIGSEMNRMFEVEALRRGYSRVQLNARVVAVAFYNRLGYRTIGDEFTEVSVPHVRMEKILLAGSG